MSENTSESENPDTRESNSDTGTSSDASDTSETSNTKEQDTQLNTPDEQSIVGHTESAKDKRNFYLVGLMAVGKSTVGRALADQMRLPFYDSDNEIEARAGAEISWIFDVEGESGFRDREEHVIDELTRQSGVVLATGGGVVKSAQNRRNLAARGVVIHLDSPLHRLVARTRRDKKRPLLQSNDPEKILSKLLCERGPLYKEIADYRFVTDKQSVKALVDQIMATLRNDGLVR